jgi:membrane fusion protein, adhesin transport system
METPNTEPKQAIKPWKRIGELLGSLQNKVYQAYLKAMQHLEAHQVAKLSSSGFSADRSLKNLEKPARSSHVILFTVVLFFVIAIAWAKWAILDEVTRGMGKVIPSTQIQVIQNLEGGIVKEITVKEGDIVSKGQKLLVLDDTRFKSSYREAQVKQNLLTLKVARLDAEVEKKPFIIPLDIQKKFPSRAKQARMQFESRQQEIQQLQRSYELALEELELTKPLVAKGAASAVEVLRQERQTNDLLNAVNSFTSATLNELNNSRSELAGLYHSSLALRDRLTRTTVQSPVKGIVKQLKINTVGGVIQPGMDLMEIVPLDDSLLIEAKIRPQDIGFLHSNQKANVKITAYDYSIYGGLDGIVEQISADTITDEDDESYYIIRVRTNKNHLGNTATKLNIIPGMAANVDILTGHKSVLDYLLKPILKARQNALRER